MDKGLSDWIKASDLDDVERIIVSEPPPIPKQKKGYREIDATYTGIVVGLCTWFFFHLSENTTFFAKYFSVVVFIFVLSFILRIVFTIWANKIAKKINRGPVGWSIFAFIAPSSALTIIGLLRKREVVDE